MTSLSAYLSLCHNVGHCQTYERNITINMVVMEMLEMEMGYIFLLTTEDLQPFFSHCHSKRASL